MTSPMASGDAASSALTVVPTDLLICVFVHGYAFYRMCGRRPTVRGRFKGDNDTFVDFPSRLQHILSHTITHANVECVVSPAYDVSVSSPCQVLDFDICH